ncbi:MAG: hypothetical protein SFV81_07810 [Pirellulaceae bacterium]|nr:hypothetical protein [Pirellulaceae bacterium]
MDRQPTQSLKNHIWRTAGSLVAILLCSLSYVCFCSPCYAQMQDSFEGGVPRWKFVESDSSAQLTLQEISLVSPHGGQTSEMLQVASGNGTFIYVAYPIEPCVVVDEFQPRLWTRCASAGLRVGVRIVFPSSFHPVTGGRLTAIAWGDTYSDPGQWQALKLTNLQKLFEAEVVALRQRYGPNIVIEDAFIDSIVMNVFTGPGNYRLLIDDLNLQGHISLPSVGRSIPVNWREAWLWRPESVNPEGRFWNAMNRPEVWLQYQGESLPWIKSLGITGLVVGRVPSEDQLRVIQDAKLSVVCPLPQANVSYTASTSAAIRGWLIGAALDSSQTALAREQVNRVAQMPAELKRPVFGEALEQYWAFSRIADEVIVPIPDSMSAGDSLDHLTWLRTQLASTTRRGRGWVATNIGVDPQWLKQYRSAQRIVESEAFTSDNEAYEIPTDPRTLRHQVVQSIAAGATGLTLRSPGPDERGNDKLPQGLELNTKPGRAQVASLRWTMNDLTLWGPWIVAGQQVRAPTANRADYLTNAWILHNSYLVIAQKIRTTGDSISDPARAQPLICATSVATNTRQVFRVTAGEYERIDAAAAPGGLQWTVNQPADIETFIISENPNVTRYVNRHLAETRVSVAEDQLELATYQLNLASDLLIARFPEGGAMEARGQFSLQTRARRQLEEGLQALRSGSASAATTRALQSLATSQMILDDGERAARSSLVSRQSSPFVLHPAALKYHWKLAQACARSQWRDLPIAGADLTSLDAMLKSGWTQEQRLQDQAEMRVEWIPPTSQSSQGLRLAAYEKGEATLPGGYEGASLRIRSAAAQVKEGQLVRIKARARIQVASQDPSSGLLVYDNQVGPGLGQLVRGQPGELKEIELYRFIVRDGELRVLAECRGPCDIVLESLSASVIEPATNRQSYPTTPVKPSVNLPVNNPSANNPSSDPTLQAAQSTTPIQTENPIQTANPGQPVSILEPEMVEVPSPLVQPTDQPSSQPNN